MTKSFALAALLFGVTTAVAQPTSPPVPAPGGGAPAPTAGMTDEQKKAEARRLYEAGISHYNLNEFDEAIAAFRAAYAISSAPGLLFNIAQSFRLKEDYKQAINFYNTYLRLKPEASNRADVEARLAEMTDLMEKAKQQGLARPIGTVSPEGDSKPTPPEPPKEPAVTVNVVGASGPKDEGGAKSAQTMMTAGLATGGAGIALVITGFVFGKLASSAESDLEQLNATMGTWSQAHQDTYDSGQRSNTIAIISFIAGGAAVATGTTLWVLGKMKKQDASVAIVPTKGGTSVAVGWSF